MSNNKMFANNKKWLDKKFGEGSYDGLVSDIGDEIKGLDQNEDNSIDVRLRVWDGSIYYKVGDVQYETNHRGRWAYGSIEEGSTAQEVVDYLVEELQMEFSDVEDWASIDVDYVENWLGGKPYVIYIRTGQPCPELEVISLEDWNQEDIWYIGCDEEDYRVSPQFHAKEPRTPLEEALNAYREYLKAEGLSYLLED